jgi:coenzyme Q-binding protein COQ10
MPEFSTKRRVRHSASDMFDLVADVERYPQFVPLCSAMKLRSLIALQSGTNCG